MTTRRATCSCGQLAVTTEGEPVRLSMCHCLECQRRTGSVFGVQARFETDKVRIEGESTAYTRTGDAGGRVTTCFCPRCGSTVHWTIDSMPGVIAVAVGAFADPAFASPVISIYGTRKHGWVVPPPGAEQLD
jgi:hypothetical protein